MSSPTPPEQKPAEQPSSSTPKVRTGQLVSFSHPDPLHPEGKPIEGEGVVLYVTDDGSAAAIAPLSDLHIWTSTENLGGPVKVSELEPNVPIPDTSSTSS